MSICLIVGLGNPGKKYEYTRHNVGFWFIDNLAYKKHLIYKTCFYGNIIRITLLEKNIILLKPQTYMNYSGESIYALINFYKLQPEQILIVHDELDLPPGMAKIKKNGSSAGHNGLKNITTMLGTQNYWRLRIGIGHPRHLHLKQSVMDFVLQKPSLEEEKKIHNIIKKSLMIIPLLCIGKFEVGIQQLHTIKL